MKERENEVIEASRSNELLAALLEEKAERTRITAALWKMNPEEYGTDDSHIHEWEGIARGLKEAADLLKKYSG